MFAVLNDYNHVASWYTYHILILLLPLSILKYCCFLTATPFQSLGYFRAYFSPLQV